MRNILLAISGPSGVGKGTLVKEILSEREDVVASVSCTTRKPRKGETDKKDYFFITKEEFTQMIDDGGFLEYDEHFGNFYGTPKNFVKETLKDKSVILEIDVKGAINAKRVFPEAVLVFIMPPSLEELKKRLLKRGTEGDADIRKRIRRVEYELSFKDKYDYVITNDDLSVARNAIDEIINKEKSKI